MICNALSLVGSWFGYKKTTKDILGTVGEIRIWMEYDIKVKFLRCYDGIMDI